MKEKIPSSGYVLSYAVFRLFLNALMRSGEFFKIMSVFEDVYKVYFIFFRLFYINFFEYQYGLYYFSLQHIQGQPSQLHFSKLKLYYLTQFVLSSKSVQPSARQSYFVKNLFLSVCDLFNCLFDCLFV